MAATEPTESPKKHGKKEKKDKKRARDDEAAADTRKHKKSKSEVGQDAVSKDEAKAAKKDKKDKKEKKSKKSKKAEDAEDETAKAASDDDNDEAAESSSQKKKSSKKSKKHEEEAAPASDAEDAMDVDETTPPPAGGDDTTTTAKTSTSGKNKIHQPSDIPSEPQFPFYTQTISLYEPLYPNGWAKPVTGCESQHLRHLKNRYVPSMRGVLLDYSRVTLGEGPGRSGAGGLRVAHSDEQPTLVRSRAEFGGAFGWMTADVKLFVPSRGAWMEGVVNLQTEGHIGVVCFGKFNASIEARRLPASWRWVPTDDDEAEAAVGAGGTDADGASVFTGAAAEHGLVRQIHSTGYWVDADGDKVRGRVRFRIRNFDVGVSGDSTYLSLQGTMLAKKDETALVHTEAREASDRKARKGGNRNWCNRRSVPDFSMTRFATGDEDDAQNTEPQLQQVSEEVMAAEVGQAA